LDIDKETLETRLSRLLGWEKRKRREAIVAAALFYALLGALVVPLFVSMSRVWAWTPLAAIFVLLTPCLLFTGRWRDRDTARALAALDRTLHLDERATTAWEFLRRNETTAVALLVLRQASDRLQSFDARALFPRSWGWRAYSLAPLAALWLAMLFFDPRFQPQGAGPGDPPSLSQTLREFARRLQEKAQRERLPRTLEAARELEKIAERGMAAGTTDERFRNELAGVSRKMAAARSAAGHAAPGLPESRQQLDDLKAELEAARELMSGAEGEAWQERLAGLSQIQKQLERQERGARGMSRSDMKALLDKLEREAAGELDRRTLMDTEQFLQHLAERGRGRQRDARRPPDREEDAAEDRRIDSPGSTAGEEPGKNAGKTPSLPDFKSGLRAQVRGSIGEGEASGIFFKGKPTPGRSELSQDEVIAGYRRQAEAELDTERIPGELKDTIRNYFLSLEKGEMGKHGIR
jgi:hypothetical protein